MLIECNFLPLKLSIEAEVDMDRWQNRVAVVTGASSGIGEAIAADLVKAGVKVVALARREERLRQNQKSLPANLQSHYYPVKCDVSDESQVKSAFDWAEKKLGGVDILVNNAGIGRQGVNLSDPDNTQPMREVVDTNVMAVVYCVREAFNSMKKRNVDGHVVIINSIAGHKVPFMPGSSFNIYPATKHAVTAMTETYRQEFANAGTKVKVTSISPGLVDTEIITDKTMLQHFAYLKSEDISNAVLYVLGTPPHVQIHELMIKPVGEKF